MNNYFCSLPWVHLRLDPSYDGQTGGVSPCCKFNQEEWDNMRQDDSEIEDVDQAEIMKEALAQAKEGRFHILSEMAKAIEKPNKSI